MGVGGCLGVGAVAVILLLEVSMDIKMKSF